ncbi:hypothetical protein [Streptomyces sp. NPDC048200]|uniref:hypothetical protein n=1 Tax=Streptomyces sp. NPDC048200 TaxID=3365512 RepID=UPI003711F47F
MNPVTDVTDRHTLSTATRVEDTDDWLRRHGATRRVAVVVQQGEQPDVIARIGDTLVWDGRTITVASQERRP